MASCASRHKKSGGVEDLGIDLLVFMIIRLNSPRTNECRMHGRYVDLVSR